MLYAKAHRRIVEGKDDERYVLDLKLKVVKHELTLIKCFIFLTILEGF